MLSKPVAGVTSPVATSEVATLQEIQTDKISLQQTMQPENETTLGGSGVTKIVCTVHGLC